MSIFKNVYLYPVFFLSSSLLIGLPQNKEVVSGRADFEIADKSLDIRLSDKAIIHYQSFDIGEGEQVRFIQPSSTSAVLNRIVGEDPSKILGNINANGRVFLINPNGICFGPNSVINTNSFLASTLNILDEDFLNENYKFFLESGSKGSKIINQGTIAANPEGFVALFAPFVENRGSILAKAGRVVIAAAEKVALDFSGDGLLKFVVEGDLEDALIANYGSIEAVDGRVDLSMKQAYKAIKMVVNTEGAVAANSIEEVNGLIHLVSKSTIVADKVSIEGSQSLQIAGTIDASSKTEGKLGGTVGCFAEEVHLTGATIDASGDIGGGKILIGGEYQGKGREFNSKKTIVDESSTLTANAYTQGNGGEIIVWADGTTLFNGAIFAHGGQNSGDGGFVETSGKINLGISTGRVDTSSPNGKYGEWLLDPDSVTIATGGGATLADVTSPNCFSTGPFIIDPSVIAGAGSSVAICSQENPTSSITITDAISMSTAGVSLTFTAGFSSTGNINLNNGITTKGGNVIFNGTTVLGANATIETVNTSPATGGSITFNGTLGGTQTLTLNTGTGSLGTATTGGAVTFTGAVGGTTPLSSLAVNTLGTTTDGQIFLNQNITTAGGAVDLNGLVNLGFDATVQTTNGGSPAGNAVFHKAILSVSNSLNVVTGAGGGGGAGGIVEFDDTVNIKSLTVNTVGAAAGDIKIGASIDVQHTGQINLQGPVTLTGNSIFGTTQGASPTDTGGNITFSSTINGAHDLSLQTGTAVQIGGNITLGGIVGGVASLSSLTLNAHGTSSNGAITIPGDITTALGAVQINGNANLTGNVDIQTNSGGPGTGGSITFEGKINGAHALSLDTSTGLSAGGAVNLNGVIGSSAPLSSLTVKTVGSSTNGTITIGGSITSTGSIEMNGPVTVTSSPTLTTTTSGDVIFDKTIDGSGNLTVNAVNDITFKESIGSTTPLGSCIATSSIGSIEFDGSALINGALSLTADTSMTLIHLKGASYQAGSQYYKPDVLLFEPSSSTTLTTIGGSITFDGQTEAMSSLIIDSGVNFSNNQRLFALGSGSIDITIDAANTVTAGYIAPLDSTHPIGTLTINGGSVVFNDMVGDSTGMDTLIGSVDCTAQGAITKSGIGVINTTGNVSLNALHISNIGSLSTPVEVNAGGELSAGTEVIAYLAGTSLGDTVHEILSNPPCGIVWNGVVLKECHIPVPPPPVPPPTPAQQLLIDTLQFINAVPMIRP